MAAKVASARTLGPKWSMGQKFLHIWMFHDILKFSYFGTPHGWEKIPRSFLEKHKSTPQIFGQKILTPDLDKCESTPPLKFLAGPKKISAKKF